MAWESWNTPARLALLPQVLAGPILRKTLPNAVTVWVALKTSCSVKLDVLQGTNILLTGTRSTTRLANNLHVAAITATTSGGVLQRNTIYQYNITLSGGATGSLSGILNNGQGIGPSSLGPGATGLPSFALPPIDIQQTRIFHASCRKVHGGGRDHLVAFDAVVSQTAANAIDRPHMLFLTGDQIYADDVADQLLFMIQDAAAALGFNAETVPGAANLPGPGRRAPLMTSSFVTAGDVARSHLVKFSEFACMYLFAWSEVLWQELPTFQQVFPGQNPTKDDLKNFDSNAKAMGRFREAMSAVRRVLANIPTYMIFDDHEVSDDWFLDLQWVNRSRQNTVLRRITQNGLAAYAMFQGWENDPDEIQATKGTSTTLLDVVSAWCNAPDNSVQSDLLAARLGLPTGPVGAGNAPYPKDPTAVRWHYIYLDPTLKVRIAVLDSRTRRQYNANKGAPGLIAQGELASQLDAIASGVVDAETLILIVSPSPLIGYPVVEWAQGEVAKYDAYFPDPEYWPRHEIAFHRFLAHVGAPQANSQRRILVLSGDVHYAFTSALRYHATKKIDATSNSTHDASFVQLTCSSLKNQETKTFVLHFANAPAPQLATFGFNNSAATPIVIGSVGVTQTLSKKLTRLAQPPGAPVIFNITPPGIFFPITTPAAPNERTPDWTTRLKFVPAESKVGATLPSIPVRDPNLNDHLAALGGQLTFLNTWVGGTNIVGQNNAGQLTFLWGAGNEKFVVQELFWFQGDSLNPAALTTFKAKFDLS